MFFYYFKHVNEILLLCYKMILAHFILFIKFVLRLAE
jgi:hypothetical protein